MSWSRRVPALLIGAAIAAGACGSSDETTGPDPEEQPVPPPGPHFAVLPIPLDSIARITPLGFNNKILPTGHTYWDTCDFNYLMPSGRPCVRAHLPIRAPGDGVVWNVDPSADGEISVEGPPGLFYTFAHVTPTPGLVVGDTVEAGDTVATMFYEHSFDFGVVNYGRVPRDFIRVERYPPIAFYAESPLEQYPEPLRSQLAARVQTLEDPVGRLSYDVAGTASGNWFREGTPLSDLSFTPPYVPNQLFLGRLQERFATRIMVIGDRWPGLPNRFAVVDEADPSWDDIEAASGPVAVRLWALNPDGRPKLDYPHGSVLVQHLGDGRLRIDWFDTHDPVTAFTSTARIYER